MKSLQLAFAQQRGPRHCSQARLCCRVGSSCASVMRRLNTADIARVKRLIQSSLSFLRTVYPIKLTGLAEVRKQISYCKQIGLIYCRFGGGISRDFTLLLAE